DPIAVRIPKGTYTAAFGLRAQSAVIDSPGLAAGGLRDRTGVRHRTLAVAAFAAAILASAGTWLALRPSPPPESLTALWRPFTSSPEAPLVVFSNAAFVGSPRDGLRYFRQGADDPSAIIESYTGVGEVTAVRELVGLFGSLRHPIRVKRARLVMWDEDRDGNLVFLGSPAENAEIQVLYKLLEFRFKSRDWEPEIGRPGFTNSKPRPGEQPLYLAKRYPPIVDDYALVALIPGLAPGRWAMMLAGCTTFGTGAAAEFVCRAHRVDELRRQLVEEKPAGPMPPFEALIHIQLHKGAVTEMKLVAVHRRDDLLQAAPARP
ncbi:MAG: hypothetical protein HXY20_00270, partial [Acidobacteria bacterium]|nr:hypothetical protein [Acidobacteriota bacterium]